MTNQTEILVSVFNNPSAMHVVQEQIKWDALVEYDIALNVDNSKNPQYTFTFTDLEDGSVTTFNKDASEWVLEVFNDAQMRAEEEGEDAPSSVDELDDRDHALAVVSLVTY